MPGYRERPTFTKANMKKVTFSDLQEQSEQAANTPRFRAHRNLHPELSDPVQRLAIAMEPVSYVRPHRHPHTNLFNVGSSARAVTVCPPVIS